MWEVEQGSGMSEKKFYVYEHWRPDRGGRKKESSDQTVLQLEIKE